MEAEFTASGILGKCPILSGAVGHIPKDQKRRRALLQVEEDNFDSFYRTIALTSYHLLGHDHPSLEKSMHRNMISIESYYRYIRKYGLAFIISIFP
jgi:hypothetical protein